MSEPFLRDNTEIVERFFRAINDHDPDAAAALVAEDSEFVEYATGQTYRGPDGVRANYKFWIGAFPDGQVEIRNLIDGGDKVLVEYTGRGTNTGPMMTEHGEMPPTGRSVTLEFCDVVEIKGDKMAGGRSYFDTGSMMRQLGLLPETTGAASS
jgi:steroid delta-isomerase-like uncharacterized protein